MHKASLTAMAKFVVDLETAMNWSISPGELLFLRWKIRQ
jgi:hypothetical protein